MQNETQKEIAGIQSATSRQNTKDQVYAQNEMLAYQQKESTARVDKQASHFVDRKSGSAGMPRPTSYAVFCLKKKRRLPGRPPRCPAKQRRPRSGRSRRAARGP